MGGRLLDWLGAGVASSLPDPVTDMPSRIVPGSTALYFATNTQHLFVYDESGPSWFDIDMAAVTAVSTESIQDMIATFLVAGTGITLTYNDVGNALTIGCTITQYTNENAMDAIAAMFAAGTHTGITVTYNDAGDAMSLAGTVTQYTDEMAQDTIAAMIAAGAHTGITIAYNDAGNAISFTNTITQYTDAMADARIALAVIDALADVDTTSVAPTNGQALIFNSSSGKWKPGNVAGAAGLTQLAQTTLVASAASISFTSISAAYSDLLVVLTGRGDKSAAFCEAWIRFNNDSGANYDYQTTGSNNTGSIAAGSTAQTHVFLGWLAAATGIANLADSCLIEIPYYANATFFKDMFSRGGLRNGTAAANMFNIDVWGSWRSTTAINRVDLLPDSGNFIAGTRATLYGRT